MQDKFLKTMFFLFRDPNKPLPIDENVLSRWTPIQSDRIEYLHLTTNGFMKTGYEDDMFNFWKKLPVNSNFI